MRQPREGTQRVEIRELAQVIRVQLQVRQVRNRVGQGRLDGGHAVARQKQRLYPRGEREVAQHLDIVVDEVYSILGLYAGRGNKTQDNPVLANIPELTEVKGE